MTRRKAAPVPEPEVIALPVSVGGVAFRTNEDGVPLHLLAQIATNEARPTLESFAADQRAAKTSSRSADQLVDEMAQRPTGKLAVGKLKARLRSVSSPTERAVIERQLRQAEAAGPGAAPEPIPNPLFVGRPVTVRRAPAATLSGGRSPVEDLELTEADFEWMRRLPVEVKKIPIPDARRLLALADAVAPRSSDKHLLDSIVGPLKEHHEYVTRKANLEATIEHLTAKSLPGVAPAAALARQFTEDEVSVVADRLIEENAGLSADEASSIAASRLQEAAAAVKAQRKAERNAALAEAQIELAELTGRSA